MAFIVKRETQKGSIRYDVVFVDHNGKRRQRVGGSRWADAEALRKRLERELADGTYGNKLEEITFADFSKKWLEEYAELKVKPRTYADYEQVVQKHLNPFFGKMLLSNIKPGNIQEYVSRKAKENLSPRTVNKTITVLKMIMKRAVIWEYLKDNPARFTESLKEEKNEMEFLKPDEIRRFLSAASPEYYPLFAAAVLTGCRQGELMGLRWSDVDLEQGVIYIRRTYHPQFGFGKPKTKMGERAIVISPELVNILQTHRQQQHGKARDLVFQNKAGGPINHQNMMTRQFYPTLELAGLRRIRFHDLRHTYAALMISMGENIKFIQKQLGHASLITTMDTYGHLLPEVSQGFGKRLDTLVFSDKVLSMPQKKK